jgi:hypothetical protein
MRQLTSGNVPLKCTESTRSQSPSHQNGWLFLKRTLITWVIFVVFLQQNKAVASVYCLARRARIRGYRLCFFKENRA